MPEAFATEADRRACAALIAAGSKSFHLASHFLPADMREAALAIYAFCRVADDEIDDGQGAQRLDRLRERLDRVFAGRPGLASAERALADAVRAYALPRAPFDALLEGFAWDLEGRRYETTSELLAYAARVAGSVGAMMAALMGVRAPAMVARACDLGVAMQLTNVARDVAEDASIGRLYLPLQELRRRGLDPEAWLASPRPHGAVAAAAADLLALADRLYADADAAIARLPSAVRPAIAAARRLYAEIGREFGRRGGDPFTGRAVVSTPRKALLALGALSPPRRGPLAEAPRPESRFLVEAVARPNAPIALSWGERVVWAAELLARLEARDRARRAPA